MLEVNLKFPVFVVLCRNIDRVTGASGADWAILQSGSNPPRLGHGFRFVNATLLEQKMLLNLEDEQPSRVVGLQRNQRST